VGRRLLEAARRDRRGALRLRLVGHGGLDSDDDSAWVWIDRDAAELESLRSSGSNRLASLVGETLWEELIISGGESSRRRAADLNDSGTFLTEVGETATRATPLVLALV
jgi:hypothetical protein